jgi:hypothetical protein
MNNYTIGNGTIKNIANAIRAQQGGSEDIQVSDFASRIAAIVPDTRKTGDISNPNTEYYGIDSATVLAIGNALKEQDKLTGPVSGFAQRILNLHGESWDRPSYLPNYDYIDRTNEDAIYLTVQAPTDSTTKYLKLELEAWYEYYKNGAYVLSSTADDSQFLVQRGYIDANGFHENGRHTYFSSITVPGDEGNYLVYRISTVNEGYYLKKVLNSWRYAQANASTWATQAHIIEVWGHADCASELGVRDQYTLSWDVICRGGSQQHFPHLHRTYEFDYPILKSFDYGRIASEEHYQYDYVVPTPSSLINLEFMNWNKINLTDMFNKLSYVYGSNSPSGLGHMFSRCTASQTNTNIFKNKTIKPKVNYSMFYKNASTQITFPICTFIIENASYETRSLLEGWFDSCNNLTTVNMSNMTVEVGSYSTNGGTVAIGEAMFDDTPKLQTVYLPTLTGRRPASTSYPLLKTCGIFYQYWNNSDERHTTGVSEVYNTWDLFFHKKTASSDWSAAPNLSEATMVRFFNSTSATTDTQHLTITVSQSVANRLSPEDIAIFTDKGHTLTIKSE